MSDRVTIRGATSDNWLLWILLAFVLFAGDPNIFEGLRHWATEGIQECKPEPPEADND